MKLLLDTHTFLWWLSDPSRLSSGASSAVGDTRNRVFISVVVLWEIAIKRSIGKLTAKLDIERVVGDSGFELLKIEVTHIAASERLPFHHRDPFDRLLVAQSIVENATLVTRDPDLLRYGAPVLIA